MDYGRILDTLCGVHLFYLVCYIINLHLGSVFSTLSSPIASISFSLTIIRLEAAFNPRSAWVDNEAFTSHLLPGEAADMKLSDLAGSKKADAVVNQQQCIA